MSTNASLNLPVLLCLIAGVCATTSAVAQTPGEDVAQITFDATPQMKNMSYDGFGVKATRVTLAGKTYDAWMAQQTLDSHRGWERSWRLKVNNPAFFKDKRTAVDIEIVYHLPAFGSVEVYAATADGPKHIGGGWGNSKDWKTMHLRLDNAAFSNDDKGGEQLGPFDLRISGSNAPVYLKSVKLTFYDPLQNVHWDRMLNIEHFAGDTPGGVLVFSRKPSTMKFGLRNLAFIDRPAHYRFELQDADGKVLQTDEQDVTVKASSVSPIVLPFDPTAWPFGPYKGQLQVIVDDKPALAMPMRLGVMSDTAIEKARNDEFFYGLDPANTQIYPADNDAAAAYYRLMGVDFLRNLPISGGYTPEKADAAMAFLAHEQLRASVMFDPPKPAKLNGPTDQNQLDKVGDELQDVVTKYAGRSPGHLFMAELGNEPDLPFFWPDDVKQFVDELNVMADRAHAGRDAAKVAPGDFWVTNGGLSFAGTVGDARARQLLKLFDPTKLDLIAYHGHGPLIGAERSAYERQMGARVNTAVANLPTIETESGYSAASEIGLMDQARTVVEKMVYGQSVKLVAFDFFRLFMEGTGTEGGYGLTEQTLQPRPSIFAYRNMTERLRHRRFANTLDATTVIDAKGLDLYVFQETRPDATPTGGKTIVAFSESQGTTELAIRLDAAGADVHDVKLYDLFGNPKPIRLLPANVALLPVSADPSYLSWSSTGDASAVGLIPPLLALSLPDPLLEGTDGSAKLIVRNPSPQLIAAKLTIDAASGSGAIDVRPTAQSLNVPANGQVEVPLAFHVGASDAVLDLPKWWRVYPDADPKQLDGATWTTLPLDLKKVDGTPSVGQPMFAAENKFEFTKPFGNPKEHRPAVGLAYIDCAHDTTLSAVANADWWMDWYVNGQLVFDSERDGKGAHGSMLDHPFDLPLKAGRNVVAFNCGSGSQGWSIQFGGPRVKQQATPGAPPLDRLHAVLDVDGKELAVLTAPLAIAGPVPAAGSMSDVDATGDWTALEPFAVFGADRVQNLFYKEPDASRWYKGVNDLSAVAWLRDDPAAGKVHLVVAVKDDKHVPAAANEPLDAHDSLHCVVAGESGSVLADLTLAAQGQGVQTDAKAQTRATRDESAADGPTTWYRITLSRSLLADGPFRVSLRIADDDGFGLKQTIELGSVSRPDKGVRTRLDPSAGKP